MVKNHLFQSALMRNLNFLIHLLFSMQFTISCVHGFSSRNYLCIALVMSELLMLHKEIFQAQSKHCGKYWLKF